MKKVYVKMLRFLRESDNPSVVKFRQRFEPPLSPSPQVEAAGQELQLRTQHLHNLREELSSMKRLLDVTQRRVGGGAGLGGVGEELIGEVGGGGWWRSCC